MYPKNIILYIKYNVRHNKGRPNYLSKSNNSSTGLDEPEKPKLTPLKIGKPC